MKLRHKLDDPDYKMHYVFVTTVDIGSEYHDAISGVCLYEFREKRKIVRILAGYGESKCKSEDILPKNPRKTMGWGSGRPNSMSKGKGCSIGIESELLAALK